MTSGEKALYHSIIEQLKDKELSDSQKDNFVKKLEKTVKVTPKKRRKMTPKS